MSAVPELEHLRGAWLSAVSAARLELPVVLTLVSTLVLVPALKPWPEWPSQQAPALLLLLSLLL